MNQTQALGKLRKALGPKFGYRVDPKALNAEQREEAAAQARQLSEQRQKVEADMKARREELLRDPAYQALRVEFERLGKARDELASAAHRKRIVVGVVEGLFFSICAAGDNWDEVVSKASGRTS